MNNNKINMLVVDDEEIICNVVTRYFRNEGFNCKAKRSAQSALLELQSHPYQVVLTDIKMVDFDGKWLLHEIRANFPNVVVIMMTGMDDTKEAIQCLKIGAYDYILKPFNLEELKMAVFRALEHKRLLEEKTIYQQKLEQKVQERTIELVRAYDEIEMTYQRTLEALISALDLRERSTGGHSKRVVELSRLLAQKLGLRGNKLVYITRGALLHDVGKIGIPDSILLKPAPLTEKEWEVMKIHPAVGYNMLQDIKFLQPSLKIVRSHHEHYDGSGYPDGLKGKEIPLEARIFAVVDAFDAITSDRVYKKAKSITEAQKEILRNVETQFDPEIVQTFLKLPLHKIKKLS